MSKEYVQYFHHLASTLLTEWERQELYRSLRLYQGNPDVQKLARAIKRLLTTPERSKLLPYIRAPMVKWQRTQFDHILGVHGHGYSDITATRNGITVPPGSDLLAPERHIIVHGTRGGSMGFSIRGGSEFGLGIYVSNIRPGSPAYEAGLHVGDHILSVNGVDLECVANSSAVKVLSSSELLDLLVLRSGKVPEWKVARERLLWYDVALRRVVSSAPVSEKRSPVSLVERKLVITISQDSDFIGLNIRGGKEYGTGIYISRVDPGGQAARTGLASGDQIIRVNSIDFQSISHADAVDSLRSSTNLIVTIRSVGKYPVFKELYAEYTWSDGTGAQSNTTNSSSLTGRLITVPGENSSQSHTQRARARESSIDLRAKLPTSPNSTVKTCDFNGAIEELEDALDLESQLCYPGDKDIMFRRNYEDSWQAINTLNDNYTRPIELTTSWSTGKKDSLSHNSDLGEDMLDYATFLEQSALREQSEGERQKKTITNVRKDDNVIIETTVVETKEEAVTSFSSTPYAQTLTSTGSDLCATKSTDHVYSQVNDLTGKFRNDGRHHKASSPLSSGQSSPVYATVNKIDKAKRSSGIHNVDHDDINEFRKEEKEVEMLTSHIERLEARKSNLGSWEISRVTGGSSSGQSDKSDSYEKPKSGTWTSLKKKIKGSLRNKGTGEKKRLSIPSSDAYGQVSSIAPTHQKGVFERSFGSQILNTSASERYNLMGLLEDHARTLLTEDESKAVMRHIHSYHDNKDLDRLMELLLTILDKNDKKLLLVDVRNVIAPSHIERFDNLVADCNVEGYEQWLNKFNSPDQHLDDLTSHDDSPKVVPVKPARSKTSKTGSLYNVNGQDSSNQVPSFTKQDFEQIPGQLEVVIMESEEGDKRGKPVIEAGQEIVYISKHKTMLGLEICGGCNDRNDQAIRVKRVIPGGAASDDRRLKPGMEITKVDGHSVLGLSREEAESHLQTAFSIKQPVNLGIHICNSH